MYAKQ